MLLFSFLYHFSQNSVIDKYFYENRNAYFRVDLKTTDWLVQVIEWQTLERQALGIKITKGESATFASNQKMVIQSSVLPSHCTFT